MSDEQNIFLPRRAHDWETPKKSPPQPVSSPPGAPRRVTLEHVNKKLRIRRIGIRTAGRK